jgi:hypothetical protein
MYEYRVVIVRSKALGGRSYSERQLQDALDAHGAQGWHLRFITPEKDRLLVTFEKETAV